jgi:hypothetical protein
MCGRTGKGIANHYKKGHTRRNGLHLESGVCYCEECFNSPECEEHFKKAWAEMWKNCEERAEENWEKYGVYTNVGHNGGPSFYFGYTKLEDGTLAPYLSVYPDCPKYAFEKKLGELQYKMNPDYSNVEEVKTTMRKAHTESEAPDNFKDMALKDKLDFIDRLVERYGPKS